MKWEVKNSKGESFTVESDSELIITEIKPKRFYVAWRSPGDGDNWHTRYQNFASAIEAWEYIVDRMKERKYITSYEYRVEVK